MQVMITATMPEDGDSRLAADICCVVDTSGSMGSAATLKDTDASEALGLSILDLVKHSLKVLRRRVEWRRACTIIMIHDFVVSLCTNRRWRVA